MTTKTMLSSAQRQYEGTSRQLMGQVTASCTHNRDERWENSSNDKAQLSEVLSVKTGIDARTNVACHYAEKCPGDDKDRRERTSVRGREEAEQGKD